MITVVFGKNHISIMGHAEYAEHGKDILCSAVSATSRMLSYQIGWIGHQAPGELVIEYADTPDKIGPISAFQRLMLELSQQYPENIEVEEWIL